MPIILPLSLTTQEIRVLQEFRRLATDRLTVEQIKAIKHPSGGGEAPAATVAAKGFLTAEADAFVLTQQGKDFLAIDAKPLGDEGASGEAEEAVE